MTTASEEAPLLLTQGYWLTCTARSQFDPAMAYVQRLRCSSARAAVNLVRIHLRTLGAVQQDPDQDEAVWRWVDDGYREALASLDARAPYRVEFVIAQATWTWSVRSVLFLPTPGRAFDCPLGTSKPALMAALH